MALWQESGTAFFQFLSTKKVTEGEPAFFSFGCLFGTSDPLDRALLRTQMTIVHTWIEAFKQMPLSKIISLCCKALKSINFAGDVQILRQVILRQDSLIRLDHSALVTRRLV